MKKKPIIIATAIIVLAGGAFAAFQLRQPSANVAEAALDTTAQAAGANIVVDGRVVPSQSADLSLPTNGVIARVLVSEGEQVTAGQVLVQIESARQRAALAQTEAQLARAQARLAEVGAGARSQEVAAAQAALAAAQARLDRIVSGPLAADLAAAEAALAEAVAAQQKTQEGASQQQRIAAEAELANAEAMRRQAQAAYDRVAGNADIGARPEAAQLEQATNAVQAAQARLADLQNGATAADIAAARARVSRAQAQLDALTAVRPSDLAAAQADVDQFQSQLDLLEAGARTETLAVLQAEVAAAQAAVDQAKAALAETELRAPFAGVVAMLDARTGEQAAAGVPIVRLANLDAWQIETEDLTEFDAVAIDEGMPASITFDAIPGLEKTGVVKLVRPIGEDKRGDIVYTVVVTPDQQDERLLWNLTAVVSIDPR